MASDKHTRIVYAFAIAKKPITAKMILCGTQKTAKEIENKIPLFIITLFFESLLRIISVDKVDRVYIERRTGNQSICVKVTAIAAPDHLFQLD